MKPAMKRLYAKGRLRPGEMNATESAYAAFLEAEQQAGRIEKFWFESMKVKIAAGKCWYTPDFMVLRPNGEIELHEVKGTLAVFQDDARVKVKVAASQYPFRMFVVFPKAKRQGCGWNIEEF